MNRNTFPTGNDSAPSMGIGPGMSFNQDQLQQRMLLGGSGGFDLSDRIAAFANSGVDLLCNGHSNLPAATCGKLGGPPPGGDTLKGSLQSDGKLLEPVTDLTGYPHKPVNAQNTAVALAAVFPPTFEVGHGTTPDASVQINIVRDEDWKRKQRLEQNKLSARRSRKRKKIILEELQTTVDQLNAEYKQLERQNKALEAELKRRKLAAAKTAGKVEKTAELTNEADKNKVTAASSTFDTSSNEASVAGRPNLLTQLATIADSATPTRTSGTDSSTNLQERILALYQQQQTGCKE